MVDQGLQGENDPVLFEEGPGLEERKRSYTPSSSTSHLFQDSGAVPHVILAASGEAINVLLLKLEVLHRLRLKEFTQRRGLEREQRENRSIYADGALAFRVGRGGGVRSRGIKGVWPGRG
jgi:hypothetical protein